MDLFFLATDDDFQLLSKNFARIRNQLSATNDLLDKYKEYYESGGTITKIKVDKFINTIIGLDYIE